MRASPLRTIGIIVRSISITLAIAIPTIFEVHRRRYARPVADRRLRWWAARLLALVDLRLEVVDPHRVAIPADRPCILMSNHSSLYDIPLLFAALPGSIRMLAKKELFRVPIWGRGLAAGEFVSIDRGDRWQAVRDLRAARDKIASGIVLWIAPEGRRSRDGRIGSFKKGGFMLALETGATIVPIGIRGAREVLPAKTLRFQLGRKAEVHVGRPIDAARYSVASRSELITEVRRRIHELAGEPSPQPAA